MSIEPRDRPENSPSQSKPDAPAPRVDAANLLDPAAPLSGHPTPPENRGHPASFDGPDSPGTDRPSRAGTDDPDRPAAGLPGSLDADHPAYPWVPPDIDRPAAPDVDDSVAPGTGDSAMPETTTPGAAASPSPRAHGPTPAETGNQGRAEIDRPAAQSTGDTGTPDADAPPSPEPRGPDAGSSRVPGPGDPTRPEIDDPAPSAADGRAAADPPRPADSAVRPTTDDPIPAEAGTRNPFGDSGGPDRITGGTDARPDAVTEFAAAVERAGAFADRLRGSVDAPPDLRERAVTTVLDRYGIRTPEERAAVEQVHNVITEHLAPLVTYGTVKILEAARAAVAEHPDTRVVFVGRDGHSPALAAQQLDPEFFRRHCTEVTVSRRLADASLQDLERHSGRTFPEVEVFRGARDQVDPGDIPGTRAQLTNYLEDRGVPVATPGSRILLIDTSYRGTVQELLSAQYPDVHFEGHYLFHAESPDDPHPGSKTGHLLHISADGTRTTDEFATVFSRKDEVLTIEHMLRGPLSKAVRFDDLGRPEQRLEAPVAGLDPAATAPIYRSEAVRLAALDIAQIAVAQHSRQVADSRAAGLPWRPDLSAAAARAAGQVRSWSEGHDTVDPALRTVLDSFVRRSARPPAGE
ncbi:hypothetical protein [Nocardia aurantia]|uniref:Uncharacterized protein n=1 Tax=Nocardia aurantia TaxID=2585199 RepID=A0A7K0DUD9_9NOCA|nr:hypothetical protein [Nocardia aurantia]MQY29375.1 hypothetical protein [Nocardia aurantia]